MSCCMTDCLVVRLTHAAQLSWSGLTVMWCCWLFCCGTDCPMVRLSVLLYECLSCCVTVCPAMWLSVPLWDCLSCCVSHCHVVRLSVLLCDWLSCGVNYCLTKCPMVWMTAMHCNWLSCVLSNVLWCDWPTAMWCDCLSCIVTDCNTLLLTVMPCDCLLSSKARSGINVYGVHSKILPLFLSMFRKSSGLIAVVSIYSKIHIHSVVFFKSQTLFTTSDGVANPLVA